MSPEQNRLLDKARNYCAFQERSLFETKTKLESWLATESTVKKILLILEQEGFIDEERYANIFAISKLRQNKWGKNKIIYALRQKQVPDLFIQMAIGAIEDDEYINILKTLISRKKKTESETYKEQAKLVVYAQQKGFQPSLAWRVVKGEI